MKAGSDDRRYHSRVPVLRPFRALRFNASGTRLSELLAPPYDIVSPAQRTELLARDPHNAVRIDLPADVGSGDDESYRAAARTVAEWRTARVLVKDRQPTLTVHRMTWLDGQGLTRSCTGLFARLRLEGYAPGAGVLPHERTMRGPREDRYQLLKATGLNTSPIVVLAGSDAAATSAGLSALVDGPADVEATTDDGVTHRLWICPTPDRGLPGGDGRDAGRAEGSSASAGPTAVLDLMASAPVTIADGHHRYETALRYRAERGANRACESDPAWDYVLALIYPLDQSPSALPTHRVIRGRPFGQELIDGLAEYASIERMGDREALLRRMSEPATPVADETGTGRIGLLTGDLAVVLTVDRPAAVTLLDPGLSEASRGLDVNVVSAIIERVYGGEPGSMADDGRLWYVKDAREAARQVETEAASACFLLDAMPAAAVALVARAGEVMPHKSTYFDPKAPTGLLFSPMEW